MYRDIECMIDCSGKCQSTKIQMQIHLIYNRFNGNSNWPTIRGRYTEKFGPVTCGIFSGFQVWVKLNSPIQWMPIFLYIFFILSVLPLSMWCAKRMAKIIAWKKCTDIWESKSTPTKWICDFFVCEIEIWKREEKWILGYISQPAPSDLYFCYRFWPRCAAACRKPADEPHAPCAISPMMTCTSVSVSVYLCKRWFSSLLFFSIKMYGNEYSIVWNWKAANQQHNSIRVKKKVPIERDGKCDKDEKGTCARVFRWWEQRNSRLQCYNEAYICMMQRDGLGALSFTSILYVLYTSTMYVLLYDRIHLYSV